MHITLDELLIFREERAEKQREMLEAYNTPLVSFTMNIPGPEKTSPLIVRAFDLGVDIIKREVSGFEINSEYVNYHKCGPVLILSVKSDAVKLKQMFTKIEDTHPIGRLFDIDVIDAFGTHLSRERERGCIVCSAPGRACAAGRLHPVPELVFVAQKMMVDFFIREDIDRIARIAKDSLLSEVYTTPKPGLVDRENSGSHPDMTLSDFEASANALLGYFKRCLLVGFKSKDTPEVPLFPTLRTLGTDAEADMYNSTHGKNTHKGAIFSYGIILGAVGRLISPDGALPKTADILAEAKAISHSFLLNDLSNFSGKTAGELAYIERGVRGIRGEAMDGFPTVFEISLPVYKAALSSGKNKNDAGVITLLHLIENVYDTCLYKRGGNGGVAYAADYARRLISSGNVTLDDVRKMDTALIERNLSPGGCADLLALTYFLSELEDISL